MGLFDNLRQTFKHAYGGQPVNEDTLAQLTPEQRARYDANMARVEAAQAQLLAQHEDLVADHAARFDARPLQGPAGEYLYGPATYPGMDPARLVGLGTQDQVRLALQQAHQGVQDLAAHPFDERGPAPASGTAAEHWAQRQEARLPFLAPDRRPVHLTRIVSRGRSQVDDVARFLASSGLAGRPDLVYGVYRVPDRVSPYLTASEKGRVVEWDVMHAATERLAPSEPPQVAFLAADEQWVARAVGEPRVLDEDLAIACLHDAEIGPERTLGVARVLSISMHGGGGEEVGSRYGWSRVVGVQTFATGPDVAVADRLSATRPLPLPPGPPAGVHVEVLDWGSVQRCVQPRGDRPPEEPSRFPYLPHSPQELLTGYLETVGLDPADCYAAQVTVDESSQLTAGRDSDWLTIEGAGPRMPCADGKSRHRLYGADQVVVAYRDRSEYATGRERFVAYMRAAYQGDLRQGVRLRDGVRAGPFDDVPRGLRHVLQVVDVIDRIDDALDSEPPRDNPERYCWPPTH